MLFGLKRYGIEGGDPLVVVLNDCAPIGSGFEVGLLDGSVLRVPRVKPMAEAITIEEPILGSISIPASELLEIRAIGSRAGAGVTSRP